MIRLIARYSIKDGTLKKVQDAIKEFVSAVAISEPETEYRAYYVKEGREFVHIMAFPDEYSQKRHERAPYTLKFVDDLYPNCEKQPEFFPSGRHWRRIGPK